MAYRNAATKDAYREPFGGVAYWRSDWELGGRIDARGGGDERWRLRGALGKAVRRAGYRIALANLESGRINVAAQATGVARSALQAAVSYAKERRTFGQLLSQHQAIQWMIADMSTEIEAARLLVYQAAWLKDQGKNFTKAAAMAKLFASEAAERAAFKAIQIHGGYGYSSEFPVERIYRDQRLLTIGEGTSEILRMVISRQVMNN